MINKKDYINNLLKFIFVKNWIELPVYYNNPNKVLRFDFESKPETDCIDMIKKVFDDLFYLSSEMIVVFYGSKHINWKSGKKYFKFFSLKKITKKEYKSKDSDLDDWDKPYIVICKTSRKEMKLETYLRDYINDFQSCQMVLINYKKGVALHMYDRRGLDLLSVDEQLLVRIYQKHYEFICESNRDEIERFLYKS